MHIPIYTNLQDKAEILSVLKLALPEKNFDYISIGTWSNITAFTHFEKILLIKKPSTKFYSLKYFVDNVATSIIIYLDNHVEKHNISGDAINKYLEEYEETFPQYPLTLINTHY